MITLNSFYQTLFFGNIYIAVLLFIILILAVAGLHYLCFASENSTLNKLCILIHIAFALISFLFFDSGLFNALLIGLWGPFGCYILGGVFMFGFKSLSNLLSPKIAFSFVVMFLFCIAFVLFMRYDFMKEAELNASVAYSEAYDKGMADVEKMEESVKGMEDSIYESGSYDGYWTGYDDGYEEGQFDAKLKDDDILNAYERGYDRGYSAGYEDGALSDLDL